MTDLIGSVTLFTEDKDPSFLENVGEVSLFRELLGTVKLVKPFYEYETPEPPTDNGGDKLKHQRIVVTAQNIVEKKFTLDVMSIRPDTVIFLPQGGIPQFHLEDFVLSGYTISWEGLGLDGFIEENDIIHVYYY